MRKLLYSVSLWFYSLVGRVVRFVKPKSKLLKNKKTWTDDQQLFADIYEPKRKFRWILAIDGIDAFYIKKTHRPTFGHGEKDNTIQVELYDPIVPNSAQRVMKWLRGEHEPKFIDLKLLDSVGKVIEHWNYKEIKLGKVDFGLLDYSKSDPCDIKVDFAFEQVELLPKV